MTDPFGEESDSLRGSLVNRVAVRVTRDAGRQIRGGHPWVFASSVTSVRPEGSAGDLAVIFDERRRFMAIGLYDPASPIRVRVLHQGRPTPIDDSFWQTRLRAALVRRSSLEAGAREADPATDAYRWVHGENDGLPGLVLDRYGPVVVVKVYSVAWTPHLGALVEAIDALVSPQAVVLRSSRNVGDLHGGYDGQVISGELHGGAVRFFENGLGFEADVRRGHKTGHFLDQRDNRMRVRQLSAGARVLDVYACTGGFSVNAAAGGARLVHRVDTSAPALAAARRNMELNSQVRAVRACGSEDTVGDAFEVMTALAASSRRFDMVIVDPPSFTSRRDHAERALGAYARLTGLALDVLVPGGVLVQASCSAHVGAEELFATVHTAAARSGTVLSEIERTAHGLDHPIGFAQGAYLKALFARAEPTAN